MAERINVRIEHIIFDSPGYIVAKCKTDDDSLCIVTGDLPSVKHIRLQLSGNWINNAKYGEQFKATSYELMHQTDEAGIVSYLCSLHCGIGKTWAKRIYKAFGKDTWSVLKHDTDKLELIHGLGKKRISTLKHKLAETSMLMSVMSLLDGVAELSTARVKKLISRFGDDTINIIKSKPYELYDVPGMSFETVDLIARHFNADPKDRLRIEAGIHLTLLNNEQKGHSFMFRENLEDKAHAILNNNDIELVPYSTVSHCLKDMIAVGKCRAVKICGTDKRSRSLVFRDKSFNAEFKIAENLLRLTSYRKSSESKIRAIADTYDVKKEYKLTPEQKEAVIKGLSASVSIITGGPGVGKTTIIKAILYVHKELYGRSSLPLLLAPTGRAARRMSGATGYQAQTIHSALGYVSTDDGELFKADELETNLIIIDEMSMVDQFLAAKLFELIPNRCNVIMVGDPDQLPSVEAGNVLKDVIGSGCVPVIKLRQVFRQAADSPIIANANAIKAGSADLVLNERFIMRERTDDTNILKTAGELYLACVKRFGIDKVALLTPFRRKTVISVHEFNRQLQHHINPKQTDAPVIKTNEYEFRIGDKVMQMRNTEHANNGDIGYIRNISVQAEPHTDGESRLMCAIEFNETGQHCLYTPEDMKDISLAYACTVHKSQGSEYDTVIVVMSESHRPALKRNLIYTAVTRATRNVAIVGQAEAVAYAIGNDSGDLRYTYLKQMLKKAFIAAGRELDTDAKHDQGYRQLSMEEYGRVS